MEPINDSNIHRLVKEYFKNKNDKIPLCDWNITDVTDMRKLFAHIRSFNNDDKNDSIGNWDTSNVIHMNSMFFESNYNHPLNINTSNVQYMSGMFYLSSYNHPLIINTSNVI